MRILVTGANGQLGWEACARLAALGIAHKGVDVQDFDLTDADATARAVLAYRPDGVLHCAAYTAVDKAESERERCFAVNEGGTRNIARACREIAAKLLLVSTDYVFSGEGDAPFESGARKAPRNVYGESKLAGERAAKETTDKLFIARVSWLFGAHGSNFVKTMLRLGAEKQSVTVVRDQVGSPTYAKDAAALLCDMLLTNQYGEYAVTNQGYCSFCEFAGEIMRMAGLPCEVVPVTTEEYKAAVAERPRNSRMSAKSLDDAGFARLPDWRDALSRYLTELGYSPRL